MHKLQINSIRNAQAPSSCTHGLLAHATCTEYTQWDNGNTPSVNDGDVETDYFIKG